MVRTSYGLVRRDCINLGLFRSLDKGGGGLQTQGFTVGNPPPPIATDFLLSIFLCFCMSLECTFSHELCLASGGDRGGNPCASLAYFLLHVPGAYSASIMHARMIHECHSKLLPPSADVRVATVRSLMLKLKSRGRHEQCGSPHMSTLRSTGHALQTPGPKAGYRNRLAKCSKGSSEGVPLGSGLFHSCEPASSSSPSPWPSVAASLRPLKSPSPTPARSESPSASPAPSTPPALSQCPLRSSVAPTPSPSLRPAEPAPALDEMETVELSRDDPDPCNGSANQRFRGWPDIRSRSSSLGISDVNSDDEEEETPRGTQSGAEDDDDYTEGMPSPTPLEPALYDTLTEFTFPPSPEFHPCHAFGKSPARQTPSDAEDGEELEKTNSSLMKKFRWIRLLLRKDSDRAETPLEVVDA